MSPIVVAQRKRDQQLPALEANTESRPRHPRCLEPPRDIGTCHIWQNRPRFREAIQYAGRKPVLSAALRVRPDIPGNTEKDTLQLPARHMRDS
jgi:hypothetical protein